MLKELIKVANSLDERGLAKEADVLDEIIKKANKAIYEKAFKAVINHMFKAAKKDIKDYPNSFKWEIFTDKSNPKGPQNFFQINVLNSKAANDIAYAKGNESVHLDKAVRKVIPSLGQIGMQTQGSKLQIYWWIPQKSKKSSQYEAIMQRVEATQNDGSKWIVALTAKRGDESARSTVVVNADEGSKRTSTNSFEYMNNTYRTPGADALSNTPWYGELEITVYNKAGKKTGQNSTPFNNPKIPDNIKKIMSNALKGIYSA